LRHPEINILRSWFVFDSLQRPKIIGYGMVFQAGVAGVIGSFFTVVEVAEIITL
jgi:hypothetical protein